MSDPLRRVVEALVRPPASGVPTPLPILQSRLPAALSFSPVSKDDANQLGGHPGPHTRSALHDDPQSGQPGHEWPYNGWHIHHPDGSYTNIGPAQDSWGGAGQTIHAVHDHPLHGDIETDYPVSRRMSSPFDAFKRVTTHSGLKSPIENDFAEGVKALGVPLATPHRPRLSAHTSRAGTGLEDPSVHVALADGRHIHLVQTTAFAQAMNQVHKDNAGNAPGDEFNPTGLLNHKPIHTWHALVVHPNGEIHHHGAHQSSAEGLPNVIHKVAGESPSGQLFKSDHLAPSGEFLAFHQEPFSHSATDAEETTYGGKLPAGTRVSHFPNNADGSPSQWGLPITHRTARFSFHGGGGVVSTMTSPGNYRVSSVSPYQQHLGSASHTHVTTDHRALSHAHAVREHLAELDSGRTSHPEEDSMRFHRELGEHDVKHAWHAVGFATHPLPMYGVTSAEGGVQAGGGASHDRTYYVGAHDGRTYAFTHQHGSSEVHIHSGLTASYDDTWSHHGSVPGTRADIPAIAKRTVHRSQGLPEASINAILSKPRSYVRYIDRV